MSVFFVRLEIELCLFLGVVFYKWNIVLFIYICGICFYMVKQVLQVEPIYPHKNSEGP